MTGTRVRLADPTSNTSLHNEQKREPRMQQSVNETSSVHNRHNHRKKQTVISTFRGAGVCLIIFAREEDTHTHTVTHTTGHTHSHTQTQRDETGRRTQSYRSTKIGGIAVPASHRQTERQTDRQASGRQTAEASTLGSGREAAVQMAADRFFPGSPNSFLCSLQPLQ